MVRGPLASRLWPFPAPSLKVGICAVLALPGAVFPAASAAGQAASPALEATPRVCHVAERRNAEEGLTLLRAFCWGNGLELGAADRFRVFANRELEATVIEFWQGGTQRVLLVRPDAEGRPLLEDLGATLAVSAGRIPWAGLDGLVLDYRQFAPGGEISVAAAGPADREDTAQPRQAVARPAREATVSIGRHIADDRTRQAGAVAH